MLCLAGPVPGLAVAAADHRVLVIAVDAIPYGLVAKLADPARGDRALFRELKGPSAVVNAFPTNSHVAWTGLLEPFGVKKSKGYETHYFDIGERAVRSGYSLSEGEAPWQDFFHWRMEGVVTAAVAYGWPRHYAVKELREGLEAFARSDRRIFAIYVMSTDGIGHIHGPDAQAEFLVELDRVLRELRARTKTPFHTVLLSDHGMAGGEPLVNSWPQIQDRVGRAGFDIGDAVRGERDVAFVPFGLLSGLVLYASPGREPQAAAAVAAAPGVDLCVFRRRDGWEVLSSRGRALIARRPGVGGDQWSYRAVTGDPLEYREAVADLRRRAGDGQADWFPDSWWFDATKKRFYPDALYRLARSFDLVENPASALCSNRPGYMFGARSTEYAAAWTIGRLRWTHGALHRDASLGFMMSDLPGWRAPDAVRFNEALAPLAAMIRSTGLAAWR